MYSYSVVSLLTREQPPRKEAISTVPVVGSLQYDMLTVVSSLLAPLGAKPNDKKRNYEVTVAKILN
jgi:hypothetical protein